MVLDNIEKTRSGACRRENDESQFLLFVDFGGCDRYGVNVVRSVPSSAIDLKSDRLRTSSNFCK